MLLSLYWNKSACISVEGEYRESYRDVCCSELILREMEKEKRLRDSGRNIAYIRYANDTVLQVEAVGDLQRFLNVVVRESERKGLSINCKETVFDCVQENISLMYLEGQRSRNRASLHLHLPREPGHRRRQVCERNQKKNRHGKSCSYDDGKHLEKSLIDYEFTGVKLLCVSCAYVRKRGIVSNIRM